MICKEVFFLIFAQKELIFLPVTFLLLFNSFIIDFNALYMF